MSSERPTWPRVDDPLRVPRPLDDGPVARPGRRARRRSHAPGPTPLHEQTALAVVAAAGSDDVAFVLGPEGVAWAARSSGGWTPESATSRLVQGLYERHGTRAARLLRRPVWSTRPADPFGAGLVKVHGKRWYQVAPREQGLEAPPLVEVSWRFTPAPVAAPAPGALSIDDPAGALEAAVRLLATAPGDDPGERARPRWARHREVAALLVGRDGAVLSAALNTHGRNRTLHAEVNLVLGHVARTGAPLPTGCALFVTLRPCRACAGLIWAAAADPAGLRVIFAEDDPGPGARNTVLCHGSDARARFARTPEERAARCLEQHAPAGRGPARGLAPPG